MRWVTVTVTVTVALAVLVGPAYAAAPPQAWPGIVIGYRDLTGDHGYHRAVGAAVAAWNRVGIGVRFVRAPKGYSSLQIVFVRSRCLSGKAGSASAGFQRFGARVLVHSCPAVVRPLLVAHELGRVLGLAVDDRSCSLMNSKGSSDGRTFAVPARCSRWSPPPWLPRLVDPQTAARARALYAPPGSAVDVRLTAAARPRIDWTEPRQAPGTRTVVLRAAGRCPTRTDAVTGGATVVYDKPGFAGVHWTIDESALAPGSYCYRLFDVSISGRPMPAPPVAYVLAPAPTAAAALVSRPTAGNALSFVDRSTDAGTTIVRWHWDFGDPGSGPGDTLDSDDPSIGRTPTHTYAAPGTYTVTLTVGDALGRSATTTVSVTVTA